MIEVGAFSLLKEWNNFRTPPFFRKIICCNRTIENTTNRRGDKVSALTKKSSGDLVKACRF